MENIILCTYMSVCTSIVSEDVSLGTYDNVWNSVRLKVAANKHVVELDSYLNITQQSAVYELALHNSEAITKINLEALDPIEISSRVSQLKAAGKNGTDCLVTATKNVTVYGSEAFYSAKPCVKGYVDVFDNLKDNVNKVKNNLEKLAGDSYFIYVICHTHFDQKSCLATELEKLNKTAAELATAVQDVQANGKAALAAAGQVNKACLVPHSNTLQQKLKLVEAEAKTCLDAL